MPRYALLLSYDGARFCGFQRQHNSPSVQGFIEETLAIFLHYPVTLHTAGRTDTGVHALGQVIHFDTHTHLDPLKLQGCLNFYGKHKGVAVHAIEQVHDTFHARFSAQSRMYRYVILNQLSPQPLMEGRAVHLPQCLDIAAMQKAALMLLGHHNFDSFRSSQCQAAHAMRTLDMCTVEKHGPYIITTLRARSFLHNQVRIIMGTLIHIGLGKKSPDWIETLLLIPNRQKAGPTAPPHGLYFTRVFYDEPVFQTVPDVQLILL